MDFAYRQFIAGALPNSANTLVYWIQFPQEVGPGTAMPNLGVTEQDVLNIAAYLATLR
jgi:cytochrome c1